MSGHWKKNIRAFGRNEIIRRCGFDVHGLMARDEVQDALKAGNLLIPELLKLVDVLPNPDNYDARLHLQDYLLEIGVYDRKGEHISFDGSDLSMERYTGFVAAQRDTAGQVSALLPTITISAIHHSHGKFQIMDMGHPNFKLEPLDDTAPILFMEAIRIAIHRSIDGQDVPFFAAEGAKEFCEMVVEHASDAVREELAAQIDSVRSIADQSQTKAGADVVPLDAFRNRNKTRHP